MIKINYNDINKYSFDFNYSLLTHKLLKKIVEIEKITCDISINLSIVGLWKIKNLNKKYRNIDRTTDVLSFPNIDFKKPSNIKEIVNKKILDVQVYDFNTRTYFLGDVVICYQKMISQSRKYNHSVKREFSFLFVHSVLHLLGYDHEKENDEKIMLKKQDLVLNSLKIIR